jgi:hypothetical protein
MPRKGSKKSSKSKKVEKKSRRKASKKASKGSKKVSKGSKKSKKASKKSKKGSKKVSRGKGKKKSSKKAKKVSKKASKKPKKVSKKKSKKSKKKSKKSSQKGGDKKVRYFRLVVNDEPKGRFGASKPKQAGSKAFTSLLRELKTNNKKTGGAIKFTIKECTRGSKQKEYNYVGERKKLKKPTTVEIQKGGEVQTIEYWHNNHIMKDK